MKLIISVNVGENINNVLKQIENIELYVKINYKIIYNCNEKMYNILKKMRWIMENEKIIINENVIEKKRFHGSLFKGIYENMKKTINEKYDYFLILSGRTIFYRELNDVNIKEIKENEEERNISINKWFWSELRKLKLYRKMKERGQSAHEGLMIEYDGCVKIIEYLKNNEEIREELFEAEYSLEECVCQTICLNFNRKYYDLGNGIETIKYRRRLKKDKYVYKTKKNRFGLLV